MINQEYQAIMVNLCIIKRWPMAIQALFAKYTFTFKQIAMTALEMTGE